MNCDKKQTIVYIVSSTFRYDKLILRDHGPNYAADMHWDCDVFDNLYLYLDRVIIIDNRISKDECAKIKSLLRLNVKTIFLFSIIDPYYEWESSNVYMLTLFEIGLFGNVFFISRYHPQELVKQLDDITCNVKLVTIPYPYREGIEQDISFSSRKHKLVVTGNMHDAVYPLRTAIRRHARWNPIIRGKMEYLPHPGYPDLGQKRKHVITGRSYVTYLASFTLMLVCPSRCDLEFLKYTECAYSGCVPVGHAPSTFDQNLKECILEVDPSRITNSLRVILNTPLQELEERARMFRRRMEDGRSVRLLNAKLDSFLQKITLRTC